MCWTIATSFTTGSRKVRCLMVLSILTVSGLVEWTLLAQAVRGYGGPPPVDAGTLAARDRWLYFGAKLGRRLSREGKRVLNMPAIADRRAQEALAPIVVKFNHAEEVGWLNEAVRGLKASADQNFLDAVKNGDPEMGSILARRDKVTRFADRVLESLARKRMDHVRVAGGL